MHSPSITARPSTTARPYPLRAPAAILPERRRVGLPGIIWRAGLTVGLLDGLYACGMAGLAGVNPVQIGHHVASGLLGREAFAGGSTTAMLGLMLHFLIALGIATFYVLLSSRVERLRRHAVLSGVIFGLVAYAVMNCVVVPLSAALPIRYSVVSVLLGLLNHALMVGLPVALIDRRYRALESRKDSAATSDAS